MHTFNSVQKVTGDLSKAQSTEEFISDNFVEVIKKGNVAAQRMAAMIVGRKVRRSYFFSHQVREMENIFLPVVIEVTDVTVNGAGVVTIYDSQQNIRTFPALLFDFVYSSDNKSLICQGLEFSVMFEIVA